MIFLAVMGISLITSGIVHATETTFISPGATWKYLDDGSDQGTNWREPDFDDANWAAGPAQLGYGDSDEPCTTVVSYGPNPNDKYITTYFRHAFDVTDAATFQSLIINILRDDGAVVYLNGQEIARTNMPAGAITYTTTASVAIGDSAEDTFNELLYEATDLAEGANVLAVEIHQANITSSDISFDLELIGSTQPIDPMRKGPYLIYPGTNTNMTVLWQFIGWRSCLLEWGDDLSYSLGSVNPTEYGPDHQHQHTITNLDPETLYYYRVTVDTYQYTGSFLAAPDDNAQCTKFLAYGDTRTNPTDHDSVCAEMIAAYTAEPEYQGMLLHVGDWVAAGDDEADWTNEFFNRSMPSVTELQANVPLNGCMGNHEQTGAVYKKYYPYPYVAGRYWSFDYGPVHFAVVDQYTDYSPGSAQLLWLEDDLATTTKKWKFLVFHEPGWSAGSHGNSVAVQTRIQPLCETYGVNVVFAGHNHYYARAQVNGVAHLTTGGGGAPLRPVDLGFPNIVTATSTLQFCRIAVNGNQLDLESVAPGGAIIDSFSLLRGDFAPPDEIVNGLDFAVLADYWQMTDCGACGGADLTGDGNVDIFDLFDFTTLWLTQVQQGIVCPK